MPSQYLTIIGNVASGKSTAMPMIIDALEAYPVDADNLFQTTNPFREIYLNDMKRWSFANELWMTVERAKVIEQLKPVDFGKKIVVVDSGLLMNWVYTYSNFLVGNMTALEWELYEVMYDKLSQKFLAKTSVIYLKYSIPTLLQRLTKRGRDYELKFYKKEYLEQIEKGLNELEKKLRKIGSHIIIIEEEDIRDFENNQKDSEKLVMLIKDGYHKEKRVK